MGRWARVYLGIYSQLTSRSGVSGVTRHMHGTLLSPSLKQTQCEQACLPGVCVCGGRTKVYDYIACWRGELFSHTQMASQRFGGGGIGDHLVPRPQ